MEFTFKEGICFLTSSHCSMENIVSPCALVWLITSNVLLRWQCKLGKRRVGFWWGSCDFPYILSRVNLVEKFYQSVLYRWLLLVKFCLGVVLRDLAFVYEMSASFKTTFGIYTWQKIWEISLPLPGGILVILSVVGCSCICSFSLYATMLVPVYDLVLHLLNSDFASLFHAWMFSPP